MIWWAAVLGPLGLALLLHAGGGARSGGIEVGRVLGRLGLQLGPGRHSGRGLVATQAAAVEGVPGPFLSLGLRQPGLHLRRQLRLSSPAPAAAAGTEPC